MWGSFYSEFWNALKNQKEIGFQSLSQSSNHFPRAKDETCSLERAGKGAAAACLQSTAQESLSRALATGSEGLVHFPAQSLRAARTRCPASLGAPEAPCHSCLELPPSPHATNIKLPPRPSKNISIYQNTDGSSETERCAHQKEESRSLNNVAQLRGPPGVNGN